MCSHVFGNPHYFQLGTSYITKALFTFLLPGTYLSQRCTLRLKPLAQQSLFQHGDALVQAIIDWKCSMRWADNEACWRELAAPDVRSTWRRLFLALPASYLATLRRMTSTVPCPLLHRSPSRASSCINMEIFSILCLPPRHQY